MAGQFVTCKKAGRREAWGHISFCYFLFLFLSHVRRILAGFRMR